jgi:hypothetical protein
VVQGCIKLQSEGSRERGGDSLSPQFQAHSAGDKLSPPRETELDAALLVVLMLTFDLAAGIQFAHRPNL